MIKIAVILPKGEWDYLANTVLDGLFSLKNEDKNVEFFVSSKEFARLPINDLVLPQEKFIQFAKTADLIFLCWGKRETDFELAEKIGLWNRTIFIDGSEPGADRRYDFRIQAEVLKGTWDGRNKIDEKMLSKCALYFRREKPYIKGIIPLPYGIESAYLKHYNQSIRKDIDFTCIFGQEEYPLMRRYARELLVDFCQKEGFACFTNKTSSEDEFYKILARSKVGISIGGGGFDTIRFWEILANNCILLTETIDIFEPDSNELDYERIRQFKNLYDFQYQLEKLGKFLRDEYSQENMQKEYQDILIRHSSRARVMKILNAAKEKGLIS